MLRFVMTKVVRLATVLIAMLAPCICQAFDSWETNYSTAVRKATAEKKMLLIYFSDASVSAPAESAWLADPNLAKSLANYVTLKMPTSVEAVTAEGTTKL